MSWQCLLPNFLGQTHPSLLHLRSEVICATSARGAGLQRGAAEHGAVALLRGEVDADDGGTVDAGGGVDRKERAVSVDSIIVSVM